MAKQIYLVELCYYTEENVPEAGATIFIRSDKNLRKIPKSIIKENIFVQEIMENNDCEGIGCIYTITEKEFYEDYGDDSILIDM